MRPPNERAIFLGGAAKASDVQALKLGDFPRVAFAGRSNVGKSSVLNALTGAKHARVSAEPGKTREMNFYGWNLARAKSGVLTADPFAKERWLLVDLPGYGYAKVRRPLKDQWGNQITSWLKDDIHIRLVVALVDGRHGFLANDMELIEFLKAINIPFFVAFTKMDKWKSANQKRQAQKELTDVARKAGVEHFIFVSAVAKDGIKPLEVVLREFVC